MSEEQNESAELRETTVSKNRAHTACAKESCEIRDSEKTITCRT